jgi:hypothetical protein
MSVMPRSPRLRSFGMLLGIACACQREPPEREAFVVVELPHEVDGTQIELEPESLSQKAHLIGRRLTLTVLPGSAPAGIKVVVPGACPVAIDTQGLHPGQTLRREARAWIDLGPPRPELGLGVPFRIDVEPGCQQSERGRVTWRQTEGKPLTGLSTERRGFTLHAQTPTFEELFPNPVPEGVLAVAPHQGRAVLEATWSGTGQRQVALLEIRAVSRSRGLPNVATDATVLIGGSGWRISNTPPGSHAVLAHGGGYSWFRPRAEGRWLLMNTDGRQLSLYSAAYANMPLDCSRIGCHTALEAQLQGGMSDILVRGMRGDLGADYRIDCAMACHTVGEPGLQDGGFHDVAEALGHGLSQARQYHELPPPLQRLANVGCLGCHGPGAIPEPSARWSILSTDVCGYCHDAPPRYGHSAAWRETRMSRSERHLANRHDRACSSCHTTWGFLGAVSKDSSDLRMPPAEQALGITCAACHAVHQEPTEHALLRQVPLPDVARHLDVTRIASIRICLGCHSPHGNDPEEERAWPMASASALWLGRGGFAANGQPLKGSAVHATSIEGCLECHRSSTGRYARGQSHGFRVDTQVCNQCHDGVPARGSPLAQARTLLEAVLKRSRADWAAMLRTRPAETTNSGEPVHARPGRLDLDDPLGRAAYNLLLVLEDPAADVHNPDYTELLLNHTEQMIDLHDSKRRAAGGP